MATYINSLIHTIPELITVSEAKQQLKLDEAYNVEDDLLQNYIDAAIITAENYTETCINQAKFEVKTTAFVNCFRIKLTPIASIDSIQYIDAAGDEQTLDEDEYELRNVDKHQQEIYFKKEDDLPKVSSSVATPITINITTGYADANTMPKAIRQACMLILSFFYEKREDSVENLPKASTNLLRPYRYYF